MLSLALAIIIIDTTLLNVSLSALVRDLDTNLQSLQWVISAYSLTLAALTVTGGRLGDLFGRKRMFMLGAILFAIGSFIASISTGIGTLLIGESIIEGVGASLMMPATASLLVENFRGRDRAIAFGIWGAIAAGASAVGPILGGFLTTNYSWRWGFRINVFVVVVLLVGSVLVREERRDDRRGSLDVVGVLLSALGLFLVVFGMIESSTYGWFRSRRPLSVGGTTWDTGGFSIAFLSASAGVLVLVAFFLWIARRAGAGRSPLVSLELFGNRQFMAGSATTGVLTLAMTGVMFCIPVFLQSVRELDALHTGLMLAPMSAALFIVSPVAAILSRRFQARRLIQTGVLIAATSLLFLRGVLAVDMPLWHLVPVLTMYGIGMGLVMAQINNVTLSAVDVKQSGEAAGVSNTFRQVGSSLGSAAIGAVLLSALIGNLHQSVDADRTLPASDRAAINHAIQYQPSELAFSGDLALPGTTSGAAPRLSQLRRAATTFAIRRALLIAAAFAFLALLVSFRLPRTTLH
ncbi:MAG TPA: DHA2 family efflux MFS transporter permease subunit [Thermoanaerobaculia bacterium]|nr:DHA2 family efflux MFS transporter permease subunit [Thermoanaerobaculia bacterium]